MMKSLESKDCTQHNQTQWSGIQKSTGFCIINDNISHGLSTMICANGSAFSNQDGTASCFFLAGRSVGDGFGQFLGKGGTQALCACISSFPPTSISFASLILRGLTPSEFPLFQLLWTGLSLWEPVSSCWSLQVPGRCLKIQGRTFHIPHHRIDVPPRYT